MTATVTKDDSDGCLVNEQEYLDLWNRVCQLEIPCAELVTRNELLALANAGELDMSCHYAIADNGNGCLGDVVIMIEPTSLSTLSENVAVYTTHSANAWQGTYSIQNNTIDSLQDDRGNNVSGDNQTEVDAFPWGNTGWVNVTVDHATVRTECDTDFRVDNTTFANLAVIDLRGATGRIRNSSIEDGAVVELDAAVNAQMDSATINSRGRLYAERSTNLIMNYSTIDSEGYWLLRDQSDARLINSRIGSSARVQYTDGDRQWMYYTEITSNGHFRQFSGRVQMYYTEITSYGEYRHEPNAGTMLMYGSSFASRAYMRNFNTNRVRMYYNDLSSRGEIRLEDAADQLLYYNTIEGYGILTMRGTATIVYAQRLDSNSRYTYTGGTHYRNRGGSYSRVTSGFNTRNLYTDGSFAQTLTAANSNTYRGFGSNTLV